MEDPVTDEELLDFDTSRLADGDRLDPAALLQEHQDHYRDHLMIARWIEGWRGRLDDRDFGSDPNRREGLDYAIGEIAAHLRQGDFLPGGAFASAYGAADEGPSKLRQQLDGFRGRTGAQEPPRRQQGNAARGWDR